MDTIISLWWKKDAALLLLGLAWKFGTAWACPKLHPLASVFIWSNWKEHLFPSWLDANPTNLNSTEALISSKRKKVVYRDLVFSWDLAMRALNYSLTPSTKLMMDMMLCVASHGKRSAALLLSCLFSIKCLSLHTAPASSSTLYVMIIWCTHNGAWGPFLAMTANSPWVFFHFFFEKVVLTFYDFLPTLYFHLK